MKAQQLFVRYSSLSAKQKGLVGYKYMKNPYQAVQQVPNKSGTRLMNCIEIWDEGRYQLVLLNENDLRQLYWGAYLETSDDGDYVQFYNSDFMEDQFELNS